MVRRRKKEENEHGMREGTKEIALFDKME